MALSNAARQRRYRARRKAEARPVRYRMPHDRRSRPQRWQAAVRTLLDLQDEYQAWHRPGRCDTDFSHLDCRSVLILIVALHRCAIPLLQPPLPEAAA